MAMAGFLAVTAGELGKIREKATPIAWMACHFSSYGRGLSNLPPVLPPGSLVLVDDWNPIRGHDPQRIAGELAELGEACRCAGVLLDFQRPPSPEGREMVAELEKRLPLPLIVPVAYAAKTHCALCLPTPPCHVPLSEYLAPWQGREVWLELTGEGETILVTESGSTVSPGGQGREGFLDAALHCHYRLSMGQERAGFTLWRTLPDLAALAGEAEALGVRGVIGLWQELGEGFFNDGKL